MVQQIIIEGDYARILDVTETHRANLADIIPLLARPADVTMFGLPSNVYAIYTDGDSNTINIAVQQPPNLRTITYHGARSGMPRRYRLAFPWIYWIFGAERTAPDMPNSPMALADYRVFASPSQITVATQPIYPLPLHNIYDDGRICFGSAAADIGNTFGQHIDTLINNFWMSNFNNDIRPTLPYADYAQWQAATARDPNCWRQWDWAALAMRFQNRTFEYAMSAHADRFTPISAADPIPELPMGATWGRVNQWLASLGPRQLERLRSIVTATPTPADEDVTADDDRDTDVPF